MKKKFESLKDLKFRSMESSELRSVTAGLTQDTLADTITIYSDGTSANDHQDYPIDKAAFEEA